MLWSLSVRLSLYTNCGRGQMPLKVMLSELMITDLFVDPADMLVNVLNRLMGTEYETYSGERRVPAGE